LQLVCDGKGKAIFGTFQVFLQEMISVVATGNPSCDRLAARVENLSQDGLLCWLELMLLFSQ